MAEHIKKFPMLYGFGWIALLSVLTWFLQNCPWCLWVWLRETPNGYESGSTTVRNLGLILAGLIALPLTLWRIRVADRQAKAAHQQVDTSQNQVATAQGSLLNERYQKGAEMLGSEVLSVRLGGIYALDRLAREHPEEYHVEIMRLLCAFVRYPKPTDDETEPTKPRPDIRAVIQVIGTRNKVQIAFEQQAEYVPNLSGADLRNQNFHDLNLSGVQLVDAKLSGAFLAKTILAGAELFEADLSGAKLPGANFSGASLTGANLSSVTECYATDFSNAYLSGANLTDANLSGAIFSSTDFIGANLAGAKFYDQTNGTCAEGLTQRQIAFAVAEPEDNPPLLDGLIDPETNELLDWSERRSIR